MPTFVPDEVVTAAKLNAATARDWDDWTPTLANLTVGSGTVVARYQNNGGTIHAYFVFTFGSGSAVGTGPTIGLPVATSASYATATPLGPCLLLDAGSSSDTFAVMQWVSTTTVSPAYAAVSGSLVIRGGVSASAPFTWNAGDQILFSITYEAA